MTFYSSTPISDTSFLLTDAGSLFFTSNGGILQLSTQGGALTMVPDSVPTRAATILNGTLYWSNT